MEGRFNLSLMDARGTPDEVFQAAIREKRVSQLLRDLDLPVKQRARTKNLVFHFFPAYIFDHLMNGPQGPWPWYTNGTTSAFFTSMSLENLDTDPTYQESVAGTYEGRYRSNIVNTTDAAKRFIEDDADDPDIVADSTGRERVIFRSRLLWTPVEGISNAIRSIAVWWGRDADNNPMTYYMEYGRNCRTRLYDSKGRKVTLNKTLEEILLVEYEFTLTAV